MPLNLPPRKREKKFFSLRTPEIDKKAKSTIILSLGDFVIREVAKERTIVGL